MASSMESAAFASHAVRPVTCNFKPKASFAGLLYIPASLLAQLVPLSTHLDLDQECDGFPPIKQTMIVCQSKVHHLEYGQDCSLLFDHFPLTGLISILPLTAIGLSLMACRPSTPVCGRLMIGVPIMEPKTPPLLIVKVPPAMSSIVSLPSRALHQLD